jgi:SAM-dependent methyltransferase
MLRDRGLDVCGIDPSPVSSQQAQRAGIALIQDFFPSPRITRKADLMFHHNVLEHVSDPVAFLEAHHANLNPGGLVVTAVPDCSECIEGGDVSMVIHEHLAYFDSDSLARTFAAAGFQDVHVGRSSFGGVLYGSGRAAGNAGTAAPAAPGNEDKFSRYCDKARITLARFGDYARRAAAAPHGVGFYVPLRAIPYLSACSLSAPFRFFDDDPGIHGKYFAGVDVPVENFDDLAARPVSHLLVCSFSFGEKIAARVRQHFGPRVQVTLLQDLVAPAPGSLPGA